MGRQAGGRGSYCTMPYDKVLGVQPRHAPRVGGRRPKSRCTGFLNARRAPLKKTENILVFYQKSPAYFPQFEQGKLYKKIHRCSGTAPTTESLNAPAVSPMGERFRERAEVPHGRTTTV